MESTEAPSERRSKSRILEIAGLFVAIVTLVVSVLLSARAEKKKELSIRYAARVPLVATEAKRAGDLAVTYRGVVAKDPYLLTAQVENTGNLPIEKRDIEKPLTLAFSQGKVLRAQISGRKPAVVEAVLTQNNNSVTVNHGLLNPGDSIAFNIIFDGPPNYPAARFRISDVPEPIVTVPTVDRRQYTATWPSLGARISFLLVGLSSLLPLFCFAVGFALLGSVVATLLPRRVRPFRYPQRPILGHADFQWFAFEPSLRMVLGALGSTPLWENLDAPDALEKLINQHVPKDVLSALKLTPQTAATKIVSTVCEDLPRVAAEMAYMRLPSPLDTAARDRISSLKVDRESLSQFEKRVDEAIASAAAELPSLVEARSIDWTELLVGLAAILLAISSTLVLAGTWRNLLSI